LRTRPILPQKHRDWIDHVGNIVLVFTFVSALAAAIFTARQAYLANKQLAVARDTLLVTQDTNERQLRAYLYVGPDDANLQLNADGSATFTINPSVKIFGITPAAWVSPNWDLIIMAGPVPGQLPELPLGVSNSVEIPSQDYRLGAKSVVLSNADMESLKTKTKVVVGFGKVRYSDVFVKPRWTEFCWMFDWKDASTINAGLCPSHNGSDWSGRPEWVGASLTLRITITNPSGNPTGPILPPF
jgi:hypothetical protein